MRVCRGPKRTPGLAARYADEFTMPFRSVPETAVAYERVREVCDRHGRTNSGRAPLVLSAGISVAIGRTDAEARRRGTPLHVRSDDLDHLELIATEVLPQLEDR